MCHTFILAGQQKKRLSKNTYCMPTCASAPEKFLSSWSFKQAWGQSSMLEICCMHCGSNFKHSFKIKSWKCLEFLFQVFPLHLPTPTIPDKVLWKDEDFVLWVYVPKQALQHFYKKVILGGLMQFNGKQHNIPFPIMVATCLWYWLTLKPPWLTHFLWEIWSFTLIVILLLCPHWLVFPNWLLVSKPRRLWPNLTFARWMGPTLLHKYSSGAKP